MMDLVTPHNTVGISVQRMLVLAWALSALVLWALFPSAVVPGPLDVCAALSHLYSNGLIENLLSSLWLNFEAVALSTLVSLTAAYLTVIPALRPPVAFIAKLRFLGLTGLTFLFGLVLSGHGLKLGLLVFGMSVFLTTSLVAMIAAIPQDRLDHARTLGMSEWRTVWEVVILGTFDEVIEIVRQNAAIGWMMLTMVEGLVRSEGGIGALMLNENKHFNLSSVFALQIVILMIGLLQDYGLSAARKALCPYSILGVSKV